MNRTWAWPAHQMLERLASRDVTSVELVVDLFERIDAVNEGVNAVVVTDRERTLAAAEASDRARRVGEPQGPLAGLPFTAKLDYDVQGQATSEASPLQSDAIASQDGPMIARMHGAGAILLGRTNEPDFGVVYHTNSSLYGLTKNPWKADRTAGGSSGGEGAAVATGMSPLGLGSDIGGSIRNPAGFNGVTGLKPGLGRYPDALETQQAPPIHEQLFTGRGPIARSVKDVVIADRVLRGPDPRDPWTAPFVEDTGPAARIGVVYAPTGAEGSEDVRSAVRTAAEALADRGYNVQETAIPGWQDLLKTFTDIMSYGFGGDRSGWQHLHPETQFFLEHVHGRLHRNGHQVSDMGTALARRHQLAATFNAWHQQYDVLLMPTWADTAFRFDELLTPEGIERTTEASRHLYIFNLLGLPAMSVPVGLAGGLPVGLHVSSTRFREDAVMKVCLDVEDALGVLAPIDPRP